MPVDLALLLPSRNMFRVIEFSNFNEHSISPHFKSRNNGLSMPTRSCLTLRTENDINNCHDQPTSPKKEKRKVQFADDRGLALATVKIMTEPSDCPPRLSDDLLASVIQGASAAVTQENRWELNFKQPASDYLEFRNKLENNIVSLENCMLRDLDCSLMGTVKVKNLAFEKTVFVRCSFNIWESFVDFPCNYVSNGLEGSTDIYDTFSFEFYIPHSAEKYKKVDFVICFKCNGKEYWDNNNCQNYSIVTTDVRKNHLSVKYPDICHASFRNWTEFASWTHLENSQPYW